MKTIKQIKKANWKIHTISHIEFLKDNNRFDGKLSTVKSIIKMMVDKVDQAHSEFVIRNSNEFKDAYTNAIY